MVGLSCALLLAATVAACGGEDKIDIGAVTTDIPGNLRKAAEAMVNQVVPGLSEQEVTAVGVKVCRSIEKNESIDKTREVVRNAMKDIGRDGMAEAVQDNRFADRVITAFKGPYCARLNEAK